MYLYHYFDKTIGPFKNLSDVSIGKAKSILNRMKVIHPDSQSAHRDENYMERRAKYERQAYGMFVDMGGRPERTSPHFMSVEHCGLLYSWYENPAFVRIPIEEFDLKTLSFTYGDMHPTFSRAVDDGKEYRKKLYMYDGILKIIEKYGMPQDNPPEEGEIGHPYYVEVQVWSDETVMRYTAEKYWEES